MANETPETAKAPVQNAGDAPKPRRTRQIPLTQLAGVTAAPRIAPAETTASDGEEARRRETRENARRVLRESGMTELLQTLNRQALQGRGWFEEYDSGVIFKWGSGYTRRHIWVEVAGETLRFRLRPHIRCATSVPECDGEYHTLTPQMWASRRVVLAELDRNYQQPVAETSDD